jgi:ubiquinone/menaquinone biosynthesis C-methylase UbiE
MTLNPATQYLDDRNLRARQRLWAHQQPRFDIVGWVLALAGVAPGLRILDVGCGNGAYLHEMRARHIDAIGCDRSLGMLRSAAPHRELINADVAGLPLRDRTFDVVLAPHMLYHVPDREAAAHQLRRVLKPEGVCVAVTNGGQHMRSLRDLVETAARVATPEWEWRNPATHAFSMENGGAQLAVAFESVTPVRPQGAAPVKITDASIAADYVASVADHYEEEVARPWAEVVEDVRRSVQRVIDAEGAFTVCGDSGAFVCR